MREISILWADDEIDLLKPHILFLEAKGYKVVAVNSGQEAIDKVLEREFDIIFLDEQMPGIGGLEALSEIKAHKPEIPVVMITKSEAENIMEAAIGSKISDYLIKPVNPNQILLSLKKNLEHKKLISEKTTSGFQSGFSKLSIAINNAGSWTEWKEIYKKLTFWESELEKASDAAMEEVLATQKNEASLNFSKFIERNYINWLHRADEDKPVMSHNLIKEFIIPRLKSNEKVVFLLIDNLRWDHWCALQPLLNEYYTTEINDLYCSILPSTTQYSRNAIFAGLMPSEIEKIYPQLWKDDDEEGLKNQFEEDLLASQLKRSGINEKFFFEKITAVNAGKKLNEKINQIENSKFSVIVYNFVDTLSHARTEMEMLKELAYDEKSYRSLVASWFKHSALFDIVKELSSKKITLVISTDHGSVQVNNPEKILGERDITTNLRYKQGRNLKFDDKRLFVIDNPKDAYLPCSQLNNKYVFTKNNDFFAYPNNYNHYVKYYKDTFQHGGISIEELMIPVVVLKSR